MKKLLSLLVAAVLLPVAANADVLKNVNIKGEIQTIASDVHHNVPGATLYNQGASTRVMAGLSADLVEDVTANLMFQYANVWGNDFAAGRNVDTYWDQIALVEANVVLHNLFDSLEVTVGRQFYGEENSPVLYFGPNHYNAEHNGYTPSIDAVKATYGGDVHNFTVMAGRINESIDDLQWYTSYDPYTNPDQASIYGADWKANWSDVISTQAYIYDIRSEYQQKEYNHAGFWGAKANFAPEAFRASAEYARNFAGHRLVKEHKDTGYLVKADIAADIEAFTVRGTFFYNKEFYGYGNFTPGLLIGHNVYTRNMFLNNSRMFNVGADVKPADRWTVSLDGYSFQNRTGHYQILEADLTAKYAHNENVELFAGLGYAKLPSDLAQLVGIRDDFKYQLGMLIKF